MISLPVNKTLQIEKVGEGFTVYAKESEISVKFSNSFGEINSWIVGKNQIKTFMKQDYFSNSSYVEFLSTLKSIDIQVL